MTRRTPALRAALALAVFSASTGCFSPNVSNEDGTEGGSGGSAETTAVPTTTAAGTATTNNGPTGSSSQAGTIAEETGADLPPMIESFTVDGTTRPPELATAGTVLLEVDASDDEGIATVEFFDGEESLAVLDKGDSLEIFLTSADSGSHTYTAVVTDAVGQTATSEEVVLSVNIVGGRIEILREELFTGTDLGGNANGAIVAASPSRIYVTAALANGGGHTIAYSAELSQIWAVDGPRRIAPAIQTGETVTVPGYDADAETWEFRALDPENGETLTNRTFSVAGASTLSLVFGPRAVNLGENVVLTPDLDTLVNYGPNLKDEIWTRTLSFETSEIGKMSTTSDGGLLLSVRSDSCTLTADRCVAKLRPDGTTEWTAGLDAYPSGGMFADALPGGGAIAAAQIDNGYTVWLLDENGTEIDSTSFLNGEETILSDVATDGQGGALISGSVGYDGGDAFVVRVDPTLTEVWSQDEFFPPTDSIATSVTAVPGAVFVLGLESLSPEGFGVRGSGWAARLSL